MVHAALHYQKNKIAPLGYEILHLAISFQHGKIALLHKSMTHHLYNKIEII